MENDSKIYFEFIQNSFEEIEKELREELELYWQKEKERQKNYSNHPDSIDIKKYCKKGTQNPENFKIVRSHNQIFTSHPYDSVFSMPFEDIINLNKKGVKRK